MGGAMNSESGGGSSGDFSGGGSLPPEALKELERFYGFDKPIYQRYLSWLGVWPREIKHRDFTIEQGETIHEKRVGKKDGEFWRKKKKEGEFWRKLDEREKILEKKRWHTIQPKKSSCALCPLIERIFGNR